MSMQNNSTTKIMELELNIKKPSSQDLLSCGNGAGIHDKLLLKSKGSKATLQTERIPRSSVLDRLQSFLPQMALANEKLKLEIEQSPAGHYDIESVEDDEKVIEMDLAVVELSGSESDSEEESSQDEESDTEEDSEVTEETLKLPGSRKRKANIQVLEKEDA